MCDVIFCFVLFCFCFVLFRFFFVLFCFVLFFYRKQERNLYMPTTAYSNHINAVLCRTFTYQKVYDQGQNVDVKARYKYSLIA